MNIAVRLPVTDRLGLACLSTHHHNFVYLNNELWSVVDFAGVRNPNGELLRRFAVAAGKNGIQKLNLDELVHRTGEHLGEHMAASGPVCAAALMDVLAYNSSSMLNVSLRVANPNARRLSCQQARDICRIARGLKLLDMDVCCSTVEVAKLPAEVSVRRLELCWDNKSELALSVLAETLNKETDKWHISELRLDRFVARDTAGVVAIASLRSLASLTLDLCDLHPTDEAAWGVLATALKASKLQGLVLDYCTLQLPGVLFAALAGHPTLRSLSMSHFADSGYGFLMLRAVADLVLADSPALTELKISRNRILGVENQAEYDRSLEALFAALAGNTHLRRLTLHGIVMGHNTRGLLAAVQENKGLRYLNMGPYPYHYDPVGLIGAERVVNARSV